MNEPVSDSPLSASSNRSSSNNLGNVAADQAVAMDRMYRVTRHIYDLTRRYYLLGRDRLLEKVITSPTTATLEVGCGTARNLIKLAGRQHSGLLYGLDASHEMLETAAANSIRACTKRIGQEQIVLRQGLGGLSKGSGRAAWGCMVVIMVRMRARCAGLEADAWYWVE